MEKDEIRYNVKDEMESPLALHRRRREDSQKKKGGRNPWFHTIQTNGNLGPN